MGLIYLFTFLASGMICLILTPLLAKLATRLKIMSRPESNKKEAGVPYLGGLAIYLSFFPVAFLALLRCSHINGVFWAILIGATLVMVVGLVDDLKELSPRSKFLGQIGAVIVLIIFGVKTQIAFLPPYINLLITLLWVLGITNALNLLDILDGLAAGIVVIASITFFVVAALSVNPMVGILSCALAGSSLAFLRYNLPPARIYMGDAGSLLVGFTLAAIAIAISYAPLRREVALLTPILILGLPIYDTFFVILMRFLNGRSVIRKSKDHFALRLLARGYSKKRTRFLMYSFAIFLCISALLVSRVSNQVWVVILLIVFIISLIAGKRISLVKVDG